MNVATTPANAGRSRDAVVDVMKGLAIMAVVLHHIDNVRFDAHARRAIESMVPFISWAVYAFIFSSGYLHARSRGRQKGIARFAAERAVRLLIPYLVISTGYALVVSGLQHLVKGGTFTHSVSLGDKMRSILSGDPIYGEQMYFFPLLFAVGQIFQILWVAAGRRTTPVWIVVVAATAMVVLTMRTGRSIATTGWSVDMVAAGMLQYATGFIFSSVEGKLGSRIGIAAICGMVAVAIFAVWNWRLAMLPVPMTLLFCLKSIKLPWQMSNLLSTVGVASGTIFAYHTPFVLQTLIVIFVRASAPVAVNIAFSATISILICMALYFVLGKSQLLRLARV